MCVINHMVSLRSLVEDKMKEFENNYFAHTFELNSNILTKTCKNPVTALFPLDDNRQMIGADRWNALTMRCADWRIDWCGGVTGICHPSTPGVKERRRPKGGGAR